MEDVNTPIYAQAKIEYTKQLKDYLINPMYNCLYKLYNISKNKYEEENEELIDIYRKEIQNIPKWNNEIIEEEVNTIIKKCDWLEDLVTAVIISHTKVLASIGTNQNKKINLTIPKLTNFIHKCYINFAREIWKNPYLYYDNKGSIEYQKNIKLIEDIIKDSIDFTIRKLLPVKEILKDQLDINDNDNDNDDSNDNNEENEEIRKTKNLQKILLQQIHDLRNEKNNYKFLSDVDENQESYFDDHVNEDMIQNNTKNLEVNDILKEDKYDNPDIIDRQSIDDSIVSVEEKLNEYKNVINSNIINNSNELIINNEPEPESELLINDSPKQEELVINDSPKQEELVINDSPKQEELVINGALKQEELVINDMPKQEELVINDMPKQEELVINDTPKQEELIINDTPKQEELVINNSPKQEELVINDSPKQEKKILK